MSAGREFAHLYATRVSMYLPMAQRLEQVRRGKS